MKKHFLSFICASKRFFGAKELRVLLILWLREAVLLGLFLLVVTASLESVLPGTVSLRGSALFFVLGIGVALSFERALSKSVSEHVNHESSPHSKVSKKRSLFSLVGFFVWASILFGNSLVGFHPAIIIATTLLAIAILWTFLGVVFGKTPEK